MSDVDTELNGEGNACEDTQEKPEPFTKATWLKEHAFKKGNQLAKGHGRPPKSKAQHLALSALCDIALDAAKVIKKALADSSEPDRQLSAAKFVISTLHKAGKLEKELSTDEERQLDAELQSLSDEELTARYRLKAERTGSEASSVTVSAETVSTSRDDD